MLFKFIRIRFFFHFLSLINLPHLWAHLPLGIMIWTNLNLHYIKMLQLSEKLVLRILFLFKDFSLNISKWKYDLTLLPRPTPLDDNLYKLNIHFLRMLHNKFQLSCSFLYYSFLRKKKQQPRFGLILTLGIKIKTSLPP